MPMRGAALVVGLMLQPGGSVLLLYTNTGVMLVVLLIAADADVPPFLDLSGPGRGDEPQSSSTNTSRSVEMARELASDVRGGVAPNTGHWLPDENPEYLSKQLLAFFGDGGTGGSATQYRR